MKQNNYSELKVAAVRSGLRYWQVAEAANKHLPPELHLSENAVTRISTKRKTPAPGQAAALAAVLNVPISEIFPNIGKEISSVLKTDRTNQNRCSKCGELCGEAWGATDSDKMSKRAESLLCEGCTLSELDPEKGGDS